MTHMLPQDEPQGPLHPGLLIGGGHRKEEFQEVGMRDPAFDEAVALRPQQTLAYLLPFGRSEDPAEYLATLTTP